MPHNNRTFRLRTINHFAFPNRGVKMINHISSGTEVTIHSLNFRIWILNRNNTDMSEYVTCRVHLQRKQFALQEAYP